MDKFLEQIEESICIEEMLNNKVNEIDGSYDNHAESEVEPLLNEDDLIEAESTPKNCENREASTQNEQTNTPNFSENCNLLGPVMAKIDSQLVSIPTQKAQIDGKMVQIPGQLIEICPQMVWVEPQMRAFEPPNGQIPVTTNPKPAQDENTMAQLDLEQIIARSAFDYHIQQALENIKPGLKSAEIKKYSEDFYCKILREF